MRPETHTCILHEQPTCDFPPGLTSFELSVSMFLLMNWTLRSKVHVPSIENHLEPN